ncbi:MAG: substrate-binding periplasmic protein [Candidatus Muiribacteriota bacterium]
MGVFIKQKLKIFYILFIIHSLAFPAFSEYLLLGDPWPPWTSDSYGKPDKGIAVETVNYIFQKAGEKVDIELHPWKRVLRMLEYKMADGVLMVHPSSATSEFLVYTDPLFESRHVLCFNKIKNPDFSWKKLEDLNKMKIGTVLGYYYGEFSDYVSNNPVQIIESKKMQTNLEKLLLGRIDAAVCDYTALISLMNKNSKYKNALKIADKPVNLRKYRIGLAKYSDLSAKKETINKIIDHMKETGKLESFINKNNYSE